MKEYKINGETYRDGDILEVMRTDLRTGATEHFKYAFGTPEMSRLLKRMIKEGAFKSVKVYEVEDKKPQVTKEKHHVELKKVKKLDFDKNPWNILYDALIFYAKIKHSSLEEVCDAMHDTTYLPSIASFMAFKMMMAMYLDSQYDETIYRYKGKLYYLSNVDLSIMEMTDNQRKELRNYLGIPVFRSRKDAEIAKFALSALSDFYTDLREDKKA